MRFIVRSKPEPFKETVALKDLGHLKPVLDWPEPELLEVGHFTKMVDMFGTQYIVIRDS